MESKVLLIDSNDVKIGETFVRRARQLVRRQRAVWMDDNHTAIRFHPGMENMDDTPAVVEHPPAKSEITEHVQKDSAIRETAEAAPATSAPTPLYNDDRLVNWLIPRAEKRMRERRRFVIRSFLLVPVAFLLVNIFFFDYTVPLVAWVTLYMIHAFLYLTNSRARRRIAKNLSAEAAMLRGEHCKF